MAIPVTVGPCHGRLRVLWRKLTSRGHKLAFDKLVSISCRFLCIVGGIYVSIIKFKILPLT